MSYEMEEALQAKDDLAAARKVYFQPTLVHNQTKRQVLFDVMVSRTKVDIVCHDGRRCGVMINSIEIEDGGGYCFNLRLSYVNSFAHQTIFFRCGRDY